MGVPGGHARVTVNVDRIAQILNPFKGLKVRCRKAGPGVDYEKPASSEAGLERVMAFTN